MPNKKNSYTVDFEFTSTGGKEIVKLFDDIEKNADKSMKASKDEIHIQREKIRRLESEKHLSELNVKSKKELYKYEIAINGLKRKQLLADKEGRKKEAKELSDVIKQVSQRKEKYKKYFEDIIQSDYDNQSKEIRDYNTERDQTRKKGFTLDDLKPNVSKFYNEQFNKKIKENDQLISDIRKELVEKEKAQLTLNPASEKYKDLEKQKEELAIRRREAENENEALSKKQYGFNSAMNALKRLQKTALTVFKTMGFDLKSIMSDVMDDIRKSLDEKTGIATYNVGTSIFTNASARESQLKYGLSSGSNYAFMQAKSMLNISNDDDIMYMNEKQKEVFNGLIDKYKTWYENLESTGALEKLQEAQLEFKMFKQEIAMKFLNWFANHKEAIFKMLEIIMNVIEGIATAVEWILNLIPGSSSIASSSIGNSDTYNSNTNSNININVNNTNNATANLNSQMELETTLNANNTNLVKMIATEITSR